MRVLHPSFLAVLLALIFFLWNLSVVTGGLLDQNMGYVSDDVWYVSSARNILREIWGVQPNARAFGGYFYATVLAEDYYTYRRVLDLLSSQPGQYLLLKDHYEQLLKRGYVEALGLAVKGEMLENLRQMRGVEVYLGYPYPDHSDIIDYLNLEHPPLGKYVIALTMLISDSPLAWRLPSLLTGSALILLAYFTARRIFGEASGLAAALFVFTDQTVKAMSMVAMLDIYLAFFTLLALYLAVRQRPLLSALSIGVACSFKLSGLFVFPALLVSILRKNRLKMLPAIILIPPAVYLAASTPIMAYLGGFEAWLDELIWALKWHVTARPEGPPSVDPVGLLFGLTPFPISFFPTIAASPNYLVTGLTIPLTAIFIPLALKRGIQGIGSALAWFWSAYLCYVALYLAGNTTLYTFYAVQFTPLASVIVGGLIHLILHPEKALEGLKVYRAWFRLEAESPPS